MPSFVSLVPTDFDDLDAFFELAPVSASDVVYDLGSGDGRLVFAAIDMGAGKAIGVELIPQYVEDARHEAKKRSLEGKVIFIRDDVLNVSLNDATVVFSYLSIAASEALKPKFEAELKPGTRIVMESFPIQGWKPLKKKTIGWKEFFLYVMPPEKTDEFQPASEIA